MSATNGDNKENEDRDIASGDAVRTCIRVRPQSARERIDNCLVCTYVPTGVPQVVMGNNVAAYTFDHVFDTNATQSQIYQTIGKQLIDGCLSGYNATILAYGQTGSGKTYTMGTGFDVNLQSDILGLVPRCVQYLFESIVELRETAKINNVLEPSVTIRVQFLELYNDEIHDLLVSDGLQFGRGKKREEIRIHDAEDGQITCSGAEFRDVKNLHETMQCLHDGSLLRATASTNMNASSSRSHAIFSLYLEHKRYVDGEEEILTAKFHFVDLAGSERLKRTGATGDRAKEGIAINSGLLALGNVIQKLGEKQKKSRHIPYRDSKLTRMLQDSLGGNSRTVMVACISPSDSDFVETLNTLKYANRAKNIRNKVVINQDKSSAIINQLKAENARLKQQLIDGDYAQLDEGEQVQETAMLKREVAALKERNRVLAETNNGLQERNVNLAQKQAEDVESANYIAEIESLQHQLIEAQSTAKVAANMSRNSFGGTPSFSRVFASTPNAEAVDDLLAEAKTHVADQERLKRAKMNLMQRSQSSDSSEGTAVDLDEEENEEIIDEDIEIDEDELVNDEVIKVEIDNIQNDIDVKQQLIERLEESQRNMNMMKMQYERKLGELEQKIKNTESERDELLSKRGSSEEKSKLTTKFDIQLKELNSELNSMRRMQREHSKHAATQAAKQHDLNRLKSDLAALKAQKVKLQQQARVDAQQKKKFEMEKNKQIMALEREKRKQDTKISKLESQSKNREVVLKRKQDELELLRKKQKLVAQKRGGGPRSLKKSEEILVKCVEDNADYKYRLTTLEQELEEYMAERERLYRALNDPSICDDLEEVESIKQSIKFVNDQIADIQGSMLTLDNVPAQNEVKLSNILGYFGQIESKHLAELMIQQLIEKTVENKRLDMDLVRREAELENLNNEAELKDSILQQITSPGGPREICEIDDIGDEDEFFLTSAGDGNASKIVLTAEMKARKTRRRNVAASRMTRMPAEESPMIGETEKIEERDDSGAGRATKTSLRMPALFNDSVTVNLSDDAQASSAFVDSSPTDAVLTSSDLPSARSDVFSRLSGNNSPRPTRNWGEIMKVNEGGEEMLQCISVTNGGHSKGILTVDTGDSTSVHMFTGGKDRLACQWDLTVNKHVAVFPNHPNNVSKVRFVAENNVLYAVSSNICKLWDVRSNQAITVVSADGLKHEPTDERFSCMEEQNRGGDAISDIICDGHLLYMSTATLVRIFDTRNLALKSICRMKAPNQKGNVTCLAKQTKPGFVDLLATGSKDHYIRLFDCGELENGAAIISTHSQLEPPHYDGVTSLYLNGKHLYSASRDKGLKKYGVGVLKLEREQANAHSNWITSLTHTRCHLISSCRDGFVKLWNSDLQCVLELAAHKKEISDLCLHNNHTLLTASHDKTVKIWRYRSDTTSNYSSSFVD